jgi:hypothetical protein
MQYRRAISTDATLLGEMNHRLIRDEGHRNPMTVPEPAARMSAWLAGEYDAVLVAWAVRFKNAIPRRVNSACH